MSLSPIALSTSDLKFAPRSEIIPRPTQALAFAQRFPGYSAGKRLAAQYEVAYHLVDEHGLLSPRSPSVTINPTVSDWDVVVSTPGVDLWTRAIGTLWVYRQSSDADWQPLGAQQNSQLPTQCTRPFLPLCGRDHSLGGFRPWVAVNWPAISDPFWGTASTQLTTAPPAPKVRLLCCPNIPLEIAYSWCCNEGETPLSDVTTIPAQPGVAGSVHCPIYVYRNIIPPQGALGAYVYLRKPGQAWHRQKSHYADGGYLWPIDSNQLPCNEYIESGISPSAVAGRSWLSSIHLAMRDWDRDVIIDTDQEICCPVISAYEGPSWVYDPVNQQIAYGVNAFAYPAEGWTLTVDGVSSGYLRPLVGWATWQATADQAFGAGNVRLINNNGYGGVIIQFTGKYAATDMAGRFTTDFSKLYQPDNNDGGQPLKDAQGHPIPHPVTEEPTLAQAARDWYIGAGGLKLGRTIGTSNGGAWYLKAAEVTPEGKTGYPSNRPLWVENSQYTRLIGCKMQPGLSNCGLAFVDHSGGGAFAFTSKDCAFSGAGQHSYGVRCTFSSRGPANNDHAASEPYFENVNIQGTFPVVVEGQQAVNWVFNGTYLVGDGTIDSALFTQANASAITFNGRLSIDNARTIGAVVWGSKVDISGMWLDQGIPCLFAISGGTSLKVTINGNKINQWTNWIHAIEAPAGALANSVSLTVSNLDSQSNGPVASYLASTRDMLTLTQKDPCPLFNNVVKTGFVPVVAPVP